MLGRARFLRPKGCWIVGSSAAAGHCWSTQPDGGRKRGAGGRRWGASRGPLRASWCLTINELTPTSPLPLTSPCSRSCWQQSQPPHLQDHPCVNACAIRNPFSLLAYTLTLRRWQLLHPRACIPRVGEPETQIIPTVEFANSLLRHA